MLVPRERAGRGGETEGSQEGEGVMLQREKGGQTSEND